MSALDRPDIVSAVRELPLPLRVVRKPGARRSSFHVAGPGGRNVALCWVEGEAWLLAKRANAYPRLVAALRELVAERDNAYHHDTEGFQQARDVLAEIWDLS